MSVFKVVRGMMFLIVGLVIAASAAREAEAQGSCGSFCAQCQGAPSPEWRYGGGTGTTYLAYCRTGYCSTCTKVLAASPESSEQVAGRLVTGHASRLRDVAVKHGSRLRLLPSRGAVAIMGGCKRDKIELVVSLSQVQLDALTESRVATLTPTETARTTSRVLALSN